jgi:dolichyl-phosphate beta-glucosyltransferase
MSTGHARSTPVSTQSRTIDLSVVVPAYREAGRIEETLADMVATLERGPRTSEIVLVNDGSDDETGAALDRWRRDEPRGSLARIVVVNHRVNRGKGAAVRTGLAHAAGDWRLVMDADNACRVDQVERLLSAAGPGVGLVVGSRRAAGAHASVSGARRLMSLMFRGVLRVLGLAIVRDTQCGFKLYSAGMARLIDDHAREDGFVFDVEHLALARAAGLGIAEVGVEWHERRGSTVRPVRDGLRMILGAARIRRRLRRGLPPRSELESKPVAAFRIGNG